MSTGPGAELFVKICGITRIEDAELCIDAGASAIGLNFVPTSKRRLGEDVARALVEQVRGRILTVGVVADLPPRELERIASATGVDRLQLHGHEAPDEVRAAGPRAFKAVRIGDAADAALAATFPGDWLLLDAQAKDGELGGTGVRFDWELARSLVRERRVILAGGLDPQNVAEAVATLRPFGVDVASGVEASPGVKDAARVRAFVAAARGASR